MTDPPPLRPAHTERLARQPGEALVTINIDGHDPLFPALISDHRWNGWAIPYFRRQVAEVVVAWINKHSRTSPESARAYWDRDTVVYLIPAHASSGGYTPQRVDPDENGRYCIGGWEWTWEIADLPTNPSGE